MGKNDNYAQVRGPLGPSVIAYISGKSQVLILQQYNM